MAPFQYYCSPGKNRSVLSTRFSFHFPSVLSNWGNPHHQNRDLQTCTKPCNDTVCVEKTHHCTYHAVQGLYEVKAAQTHDLHAGRLMQASTSGIQRSQRIQRPARAPYLATGVLLLPADIALVGVGAVANMRSGHIFDSYIEPPIAHEIMERKAVGHICGHHISADGQHVHTSLCDRTISIDFERLQRIPLVIGVAWGEIKVPAIRACLTGKLISALVTDRTTAEELLA